MSILHKTLGIMVLVAALVLNCNGGKTAKGGGLGAVLGGTVGAIAGRQAGNTAAGAIIGAVVGGAAGAAIGNYMDNQADELDEELEKAEVERVGEGIKVTFDSDVLFDKGSADLDQEAKDNLEEMAEVMQKYEDTNILIVGHTDSTGTKEDQKEISEQRAEAVSDYLKLQGISGVRISTVGMGAADPVATNATPEGRQKNRRVEIAIFADEELKERAEEGQIN
ncbi:MAG: OmpA family protein [Chitinivibrionales bacterium]|nr:OmpA family protein [Chitinivibrionales bacterium]